MQKIEDLIQTINDVSERYGLKLLYLDFTDITLISRIGFSLEIFIQIYANSKKDKLNMSLIVTDERMYGIDKEGGFYHEHPFENPLLHIDAKSMDIEDFVIKSLEILKKLNLF
jgi:hypothetical protein